MTPLLRLPRSLFESIKDDLSRPHPIAAERVGFLYCRTSHHGMISLAYAYIPVKDENYEADLTVGSCINSNAIREAMQRAIDFDDGVFHVHLHEHHGFPRFSGTDIQTLRKLVPSFRVVSLSNTHGGLVLSKESGSMVALKPDSRSLQSGAVSIVGYPSNIRGGFDGSRTS